MPKSENKPETYQISAEPMANKGVKNPVKASLQNKTVQVSLFSIAALAACGAVGYAVTRPSNKRRMARYTDQISDFLPGLSRKTSRTERLANQIVELIGSASRR